jgi:hypothetical protein
MTTNPYKSRAGSSALDHESSSRFYHPGVQVLSLKSDTKAAVRILPAFDPDAYGQPHFKQSWVPFTIRDDAGRLKFTGKSEDKIDCSGWFFALEFVYGLGGVYSGVSQLTFKQDGGRISGVCPAMDLFLYCNAQKDVYKYLLEKPAQNQPARVSRPSNKFVSNVLFFQGAGNPVQGVMECNYLTVMDLVEKLSIPAARDGIQPHPEFPELAYGDITCPNYGYWIGIHAEVLGSNPNQASAAFRLSPRRGVVQEGDIEYYPVDENILFNRYDFFDTENFLLAPTPYQEVVDMLASSSDSPKGVPMEVLKAACGPYARFDGGPAAGVPSEFKAPQMPKLPTPAAGTAPTGPRTPQIPNAMPQLPRLPASGGSGTPGVSFPKAPVSTSAAAPKSPTAPVNTEADRAPTTMPPGVTGPVHKFGPPPVAAPKPAVTKPVAPKPPAPAPKAPVPVSKPKFYFVFDQGVVSEKPMTVDEIKGRAWAEAAQVCEEGSEVWKPLAEIVGGDSEAVAQPSAEGEQERYNYLMAEFEKNGGTLPAEQMDELSALTTKFSTM